MLAIALENIGYMALVVLGVGFLIFVHELGHFLAARAAGVRVEVFSIGFGTRLFGWRDKKNTDWRICLLPIGGYVKMYGEAPGEGEKGDPDSLASKSVGWRFLVFSGGVLMNVLFAAVAFPIAFGIGIPFVAPIAGSVAPGSPAAIAGIEEGDRIVTIDGAEVHGFETLQTEAALSGEEGLLLGIERPSADGTKHLELRVHPRYEPSLGLKLLGISGPVEDEIRADVAEDGPAAAAGLPDRAELLALNGRPIGADSWVEMTRDLRGDAARQYVEREIELRYRPPADDAASPSEPRVLRYRPRLDPGSPVLGVTAPRHRIAEIDDRDALAGLDLQEQDLLIAVIDGRGRHFVAGPQRLIELLEQSEGDTVLELRRGATEEIAVEDAKRLRLQVPAALRGAGAKALDAAIRLLTATSHSNFVEVQPGSAAALAGLGTGDRITQIEGVQVGSFEQLARLVRAAQGTPLNVRWQPFAAEADAGAPRSAEIRPQSIPIVDFGFTATAEPLREIYRVDGILASMLAGGKHCIQTLRRLYATLKRIFGGSVAADNLGGIITIGVATYEKARSGFLELLFFLAILSLNLAFINVLPIPVLDGGHLMFLLVEAIKGSPVSSRVMGYAQFVGLMLVLALMLYVIFNDLVRHVF